MIEGKLIKTSDDVLLLETSLRYEQIKHEFNWKYAKELGNWIKVPKEELV